MRLSRRKIAKLYKTTNQSRRAHKDRLVAGKRTTGVNRSRRATALNLRRRTMKGRRMKGGEGEGGGLGAKTLIQTIETNILRANTVDRRQVPHEYKIQPPKTGRLLKRHDITRCLNHTQ